MNWVRYLPRKSRFDLPKYRTFVSGPSRIINVRPVRIKKPWFRRFATSVLVYGAAFQLWTTLVYLQLDGGTLSDASSSGSPGVLSEARIIDGNKKPIKEEEGDEDEDFSFIPLSWPRLRPGELYKGSDPEWKTFQIWSKDQKKVEGLKKELESMVLSKLSREPRLLRALGGQPLQIHHSWLMAHWPYRAPPQYETIGLEIVGNEIALVSRPVAREHGQLLSAALFPSAVASAMLAAGTIFFKRKLLRMRAYLGTDDRASKAAITTIKTSDFEKDLKPSTNVNVQSFSDWEQSLSSGTVEEYNPPAAANTTNSRPQADPTRMPKILSLLQGVSAQYQQSDFYVAYLAFNLQLMRNRALQRKVPPRGVFYISGPLGIRGPRGECRLDVRGEYDPAEKKWHSLTAELRDIRQRQQSPLGFYRE